MPTKPHPLLLRKEQPFPPPDLFNMRKTRGEDKLAKIRPNAGNISEANPGPRWRGFIIPDYILADLKSAFLKRKNIGEFDVEFTDYKSAVSKPVTHRFASTGFKPEQFLRKQLTNNDE